MSNLCVTLLLVMILVKLGSFMFYRDMVMELIRFAETNFWGVTYDEVGNRILEEYDQLGITMAYTFTFVVYVAAFNYICAPFFGTSPRSRAWRTRCSNYYARGEILCGAEV